MRSSFAYVFGGVHAHGRGALMPGARRAPGSIPRHSCNVTNAKYARVSTPIHTFAHTHTHMHTYTHAIPATIMTLNRSRAHPHTLTHTHSDTYVQNHNRVHSHSHTFTKHIRSPLFTRTHVHYTTLIVWGLANNRAMDSVLGYVTNSYVLDSVVDSVLDSAKDYAWFSVWVM